MTVRLLTTVYGQEAGTLYTGPEESALIAQKLATADLTGGVVAPKRFQRKVDDLQSIGLACLVVACMAGDPAYADDNTSRIQAALDAAGAISQVPMHVVAHGPGKVYFSRTLEPWDGTKFATTPGTALKRITTRAKNWNMVRPRATQSQFQVTGAAIVGGYITIVEPGHPWQEGEKLYTADFQGNAALNGPKIAVNVVPGVSWQFAATGANPTNTNAQLAQASRYQPIAGASFSRVGNVVTVSGSGVAGHRKQPGDAIWVAGIPVVGATFNGAFAVLDIVPGVSFTYACTGPDETGTGTAQLLGDHSIEIDLELDGSNSITGPYPYIGTPANGVQLGNIGLLTIRIRESVGVFGGRTTNYFNVGSVHVIEARARKNCSVNQQFDSYCRKVYVAYAENEGTNDDAVAWGVTDFGTYGETVPPCGPGNMGQITVGALRGTSNTGLFKMYCATGYDLGNIQLLGCYGSGSVSMGDPGTGVSGGSFKSLTCGPLENIPVSANGNVIGCSNSASFGTWGDVHILKLVDNNQAAVTQANGGEALYFTGPLKRVVIHAFVSKVQRTDSAAIKCTPTAGASHVMVCKDAETTASGVAGVTHGSVFRAAGGVAAEALIVENWRHNGTASNVGQMVQEVTGGSWGDISIGVLRAKNTAAIFGCSSAGLTHNISIADVTADTVGQGIGSDASGTYNVTIRRGKFTNVTNNVLQFYLASQTCYFAGDFEHPAGKALLAAASGATYRINSRTVQFDASNANLVMAPATGDEIQNTGASFGTGVGRYIRTSAPAWLKLG